MRPNRPEGPPISDVTPPLPPPSGSPQPPSGPSQSPAAGPAARPKRRWPLVVLIVIVLAVLVDTGDDADEAPQRTTTSAPAASADSDPGAAASGPAPAEPAPQSTQTEEQAAEAAPEPAPEPEPAPIPLFDSVTFEGRGDDIIDVPVVTDVPLVATFRHSGSSNFAVISYAESGDRIDLLVNEIGTYEGTVPYNFVESPAELEISADGPWSVVLSDLRAQPVYAGSASGSGDQVLLVEAEAGRLSATHDGTSNFVILAWGSRRDLLVNDIGPYQGTVRLPEALALEINADGAWTLQER